MHIDLRQTRSSSDDSGTIISPNLKKWPADNQVCKAGVARVRKIWLTRHGESEYNQHELLGGDSLLSPNGEIYARLLPDALVDRVPMVRSLHVQWAGYIRCA